LAGELALLRVVLEHKSAQLVVKLEPALVNLLLYALVSFFLSLFVLLVAPKLWLAHVGHKSLIRHAAQVRAIAQQ
jgi:hypothetical protein